MKKYVCLILLSLITGCATRKTPAPIENITSAPEYLQSHKSVEENTGGNSDTKLGSLNDETVKTEPAKASAPATTTVSQPVKSPAPVTPLPSADTGAIWVNPTEGAITHKFTPTNKGIDYSGKLGQNINAINDGKVLYSGNGLKGYGNLIIIKHNNIYLSAYAHNQKNLVNVGDTVKRGQKIATMGQENGKPILHLEVRQSGKPIDPLTLIK